MTIGIDISPACRKQKTGIEWYAWHIAKGLLAKETGDIEYQLYTDTASAEFGPAVRTLAWPSRYFWPEIRESLEMIAHPPDLLFVPSRALPLVLPKKVVTTIHDVGFIRYPDERKMLSREYLVATSRRAARRAHRIITVSEFAKTEIVDAFGIDPKKIVVTYLGYDKERYVPGPDSHLRSSTLSDEAQVAESNDGNDKEPYILCLGRRERRKNLLTLIEAYEQVYQTNQQGTPRLLLVGPPGHHAEEIDRAIMNSPAAKKITVRDWVSEEEKIRLLQHALCLMHASIYEGFGLPVVEAQACGTPVVCSNAASLPEVAGDGALFFDPHSIDDMCEKLEQLIRSDELRNQVSKKGLTNALRFDWQSTVSATFDTLQSTLRG